jgi:outer membrane protein assembly factor BamE (lipoprotein component of BamABCDE complex)
MLIVKVDRKNVERAIKDLKDKLIKTKQNKIIFDQKEFIKKSAVERNQKKRATYIQKLKSKKD